jgi:DNA repair protein RAD16
MCWWRVVLDEAHFIKSRSSQTSNAAFALTGIHRWALSGTPLQNRVGEFYSLIRFLRLNPMAHYMCKSKECNCNQIHYRMMHGRCKDCGHGSVQHYSHFNKHILNPIQRDGYSHDGRRAMFVLKNEVLDKCLLRRTKDSRAADMKLPPRLVTIKAVRLHPVEEDFYNALYTQTTSQFNDYVAGGTMLNNYAHIFDLLMKMRQSVSHPYLVVHSKKGMHNLGATPAVTNGRVDCHLCDEPPTERIVSTCCETAFCKSCVLEYMETAVAGDIVTPCPHCSNPFSIDLNQVILDPVDDGSIGVDVKESVSTVGLPSLKDLPHVPTGKF